MSQNPLKVATAKESLPKAYIINTTCFDVFNPVI